MPFMLCSAASPQELMDSPTSTWHAGVGDLHQRHSPQGASASSGAAYSLECIGAFYVLVVQFYTRGHQATEVTHLI